MLNELLCLLRNSNLSQTSYARVAQLWKNVILLGPARVPAAWDTWRSFLGNFDLDELYPLQSWIPLIQWCADIGFPFPPDLARETLDTLSITSPDFSPQSQLRQLWRSSAIAFADTSPATTAQLTGASCCAGTFLKTLKATDLRPSQSSQRVTLSCERLRLTKPFTTWDQHPSSRHSGRRVPRLQRPTPFPEARLNSTPCAGFAFATAPSPPGSGCISASASLKTFALSR